MNRCYFCKACGSGCPFVSLMDFPPFGIIRLVQLGFRQEALESTAIWVCVNCNTCASQCPNNIDIAAVMKALCTLALKERAAIKEMDIINFHLEVLRSLERYGRTHKVGILFRHNLLTGKWFKDLDVGLKLLSKRKLDLFPSRVENREEVSRLFRPYWKIYAR